MRELIFQALINDSAMNLLGITDASSFAVDVDTPEARPFLQLRWGRNEEGLRQTPVTRRTLVIWVHDEPGDYAVIDSIIARVKAVLVSLEGQPNGFGHLVAAEWRGDSEDLVDDGHKTITRNTSFELVGSGQ